MATRMQKYYEDNQKYGSRAERNQALYQEISAAEIDKFELASNATVLSEAKNNIDIEKIKKILDTKYKEAPRRRSIALEEEEKKEKPTLDDTKEYDINVILEKAKEEKEDNYDKDRLKKLRDTQYDILNNLKLDSNSDPKDESNSDNKEDDLMELINTITAKELENKSDDIDPLDILTDLKGDGELTSPIEKDLSINTNPLPTQEEDLTLDQSFFTTTTGFTKNDFDDFNDLKADVGSKKSVTTILMIILTIVIIIAVVLGLNYFLDLGLF